MGDAHHNHVGGGERARCLLGLVDALEEHLPGAGEHAHGKLRGKLPAAGLLFFGQRRVILGRGRELQARDQMGEGGEVFQHDGRIGADVVQVLQPDERAGDGAAHDLLEEVDDERAVGEAQHLADFVGGERTGGVGDRLIHQRERVAGGTFGGAGDHGERGVIHRYRFLAGDVAHETDKAEKPQSAEDQTAGSATVP